LLVEVLRCIGRAATFPAAGQGVSIISGGATASNPGSTISVPAPIAKAMPKEPGFLWDHTIVSQPVMNFCIGPRSPVFAKADFAFAPTNWLVQNFTSGYSTNADSAAKVDTNSDALLQLAEVFLRRQPGRHKSVLQLGGPAGNHLRRSVNDQAHPKT
jgi:hypothetical protein